MTELLLHHQSFLKFSPSSSLVVRVDTAPSKCLSRQCRRRHWRRKSLVRYLFSLLMLVLSQTFFFNGSRPLILVAFYPSRKEGSCDKGDRIPPSLLLERCGFGLDGWKGCVCCGVEGLRSGNVCLSSNIENETA